MQLQQLQLRCCCTVGMEPDLILPNTLVLISNDATETGLYAAQDEAAQKVDGAAAMGDFGQPQVAKFDVWKISVFRGSMQHAGGHR